MQLVALLDPQPPVARGHRQHGEQRQLEQVRVGLLEGGERGEQADGGQQGVGEAIQPSSCRPSLGGTPKPSHERAVEQPVSIANWAASATT